MMVLDTLRGRTRCVWGILAILGVCVGSLPLALRGAEPFFTRGDANGDSKVDIGDPVFTLGYAFRGARAPACMDAADANDDGGIDISDAIYTLFFLFQGSKAPPAPYPAPGHDPTADTLGCGQTNPSGFGTLLVGIHDTPPADLTEFWITIDEVSVDASDGSSVKVFPPASDPGAEKTVNLLDLVGVTSIISTIEVPAGEYTGLHIEFDHAFARAGADAVTVVPDSGVVNLAFAAPITVSEGNLTALLVDFNLTSSLSDGGPGKVTLDPVLVAAEDDEDDGEEHDIGEFHGKVVSVDADAGTFVVEVTARQHGGGDPVATGQVTVAVDASTRFEDVSGIAGLAADQEVEVEGTLKDDGTILASKVELKDGSGEDLDDDGIDDDDEDGDHDTDIDNDGTPNVEDDDDDGDGVSDDQDDDKDNDGVDNGHDDDDDNDGVSDAEDDDDDGDGIKDSEDNDVDDEDHDGTPDMYDDDDDGDGVLDEAEHDSDHDGVDNEHDADDDNDGVSDDQDDDDDGDGIPDDQDDDHEDDGGGDDGTP